MAENAAELVIPDAADETGASAELRDAHHRVGDRSTGGLEARSTGLVESFGLLFIDQRHAPFLEAVFSDETVVRLHQNVNDGVADANDIETAVAGETGL
jgi:hypothetical protein